MSNYYIAVPKDHAATVALDYSEAIEDQLIELYLEEVEFKPVWDSGFFESINLMTGSMIDPYEDDKVVGKQMLYKVLNSAIFNENNYVVEIRTNISKIKQLFIEARNRDTGIFFYF